MLSGFGQLRLITKDLNEGIWGQNILFPGQFVDFSFESDTAKKEAKAWVEGRKKVVASAPGEESNSLKLAHEFLDWDHLGFAYDELPQVSSNVPSPIWKTGTVPASAPYEVTDADITASTASGVLVYITSRGTWGEAGPAKKGTTNPNAGEFVADGANTKLIFHESYAGATFTYQVWKTNATIETIGREDTADSYGRMEFWGKGYGPFFPNGIDLHFHDITRAGTPSITSDDVPKFEIEFTANTPPGKRTPYEFLNPATAT